MKTSIALLGALTVFSPWAWSQSTSADVLACAKASDGAARLTCYDSLAAKLRAPNQPPAATAAATAKSGLASSVWPTDVNFGLQGEALRKAQERAAPEEKLNRGKRQFVAAVRRISQRPGYPLTVVLENGQVWEELVEGSDVLISVNKPVTIKAGMMGSFFLTDATHRTIRVRRVL